MTDPLRQMPPDVTLRWAAAAIGHGARIASVRPLTGGGWHANHALVVVDPAGASHRVVLRRWARAEWKAEDPDFTATREVTALDLLAPSPLPVPRVVAADFEGTVCDVPTLLLTRLPGRAPAIPADMDGFLGQLAQALAAIHAVDGRAAEQIPSYRSYHDPASAAPPAWSRCSRLWELAIELIRGRRPPARGTHLKADLSDPATWRTVGDVFRDAMTRWRPERAMLLHFSGVMGPIGLAGGVDEAAYAQSVLVNSAAGQVLGCAFLGACRRGEVPSTLVMCSSPAAAVARAGASQYSAGKAALEHWTKAVALEQEGFERPARVFSVVPYGVDTAMVREAMAAPPDVLPLGDVFRAAEAADTLTDSLTCAEEIWQVIERGAEQGSAVPVGAVPGR